MLTQYIFIATFKYSKAVCTQHQILPMKERVSLVDSEVLTFQPKYSRNSIIACHNIEEWNHTYIVMFSIYVSLCCTDIKQFRRICKIQSRINQNIDKGENKNNYHHIEPGMQLMICMIYTLFQMGHRFHSKLSVCIKR